MKKLFEKHLILKYVITSYIKYLIIALGVFAVLFGVLFFSGLYAQVENVLDLKYNSFVVVAPIYVAIALAFLCLFIGFLLYFYKYKRSRARGTFYKTFSSILDGSGKQLK